MIVTQWFDPEVKPVHEGYYPSDAFSKAKDAPLVYWGAGRWRRGPDGPPVFFQSRYWRGLAEKPE